MLKLPYHGASVSVEYQISEDDVDQEDFDFVTDRADELEHEARYRQFARDFSKIPDADAACLLLFVLGQSAVVQYVDGRRELVGYEASVRLDEIRSAVSELDLCSLLKELRADGTLLRRMGNENPDRLTGIEGRPIAIYLVCREAGHVEGEWIEYPLPLIKGQHLNTAANRIIRALFPLDGIQT